MSCLDIDEEEKDADPELNAFSLLQEPVRMALDPISSIDSYGMPCPLKQNSIVLDVLSDADLLSPVGLGNGPSSHGATQAHDLNNLSTEKEEEKSITPLKTVQEIDTAGIWGFDVESPENSLDGFSSANDLSWDPRKEFMQFLWENHDNSPGEEPQEEVPPPISQRRRKRKMDMVVMVDPSEEFYPDLSLKSSEDSSDEEDQVDSSPISKVCKLSKHSKPPVSPTRKGTQYPNGTVKAIKNIIYNPPPRNSLEKSIGHRLSPLKGSLSVNSCTEEKQVCFPCSKCNLSFKKAHHLQRHLKSHMDPPDSLPKSFICRVCGQGFKQSYMLLDHMSSHQEKRDGRRDEIKDKDDEEEEEDAKLYCPQCPFGTNCPNTFVQHAKTHEKEKRYFNCEKCSFKAASQSELVKHKVMQHPVIHEPKPDSSSKDEAAVFSCEKCNFKAASQNELVKHKIMQHTVIQEREPDSSSKDEATFFSCEKCNFKAASQNELVKHKIMQHTVIHEREPDSSSKDEAVVFSCITCSYRAFSKNVFKNHLQRRHQQTFEEYQAALESERDATSPAEQNLTTGTSPVVDSELTSKISIKNQASTKRTASPSNFNDISDLFKKDTIVNRGVKLQQTESKLDKSINILISRQRHGKKNENQQQKEGFSSTQDSAGDKSDNELPGIKVEVKVEDANSSSNGQRESSDLDSNLFCDAGSTERDLNNKGVSKPTLDQQTVKKSPSKRKMSTPYRNTTDQDSCFILPKHLPSPKMLNLAEEIEDADEKDVFHFKDTDANTNPFDKAIKQEKPHIIYTYSRRMSMKGSLEGSKGPFENMKNERHDDQSDPVVKEECIETEVFGETFDSSPMLMVEPFSDDLSMLDSETKTCPYCPAIFESGVGLSNHVRGHLHRVGLSYNARHAVSPEQVSSHDKRPRIRRKMSAIRRLKKALKMESDSDVPKSLHSCPLCGDSFDNKTGQSNHIRGHLKRLGKNISTKNKTPLCLLRELMRDKRELQRAIQILGKKRKRNHFHDGASSKLASRDPVTPPPFGIHKRNSLPNLSNDAKPQVPKFSLSGVASDGKQIETKLEVKGPLSGTSALIGILKKRKCQEDSKLKSSSPMSRSTLTVSSNHEHSSGSVAASLPNSTSEKGEFYRKVCVHCNATFHSGVSLSNHLRAYAKRKRNALLEGTTYDCKVRRQRSRPGSKKKTLPTAHTPEEMYRLTCRFCDLVFQGPLSVQEDWIKHLQRHIMNARVPRTGLCMVEVATPPKDPPTHKTDQDQPSTATHAAS